MINFSTALPTDTLLNSHVKNIVEFSSDAVGDPFKCNIEVVVGTTQYDFEITPQQDGSFYFDFRTIFQKLIVDTFEDEIVPQIDSNDLSSFVYDYCHICQEVYLKYEVFFDDGSTEVANQTVKLLQSTNQTINAKKREIQATDNFAVLSPLEDRSTRTFDLWFFEGFPFDVAVYLNTPGDVTLENKTTLASATFNFPDKVNRLFFSDGNTSDDIQTLLGLISGTNQLQFNNGDLSTIYLEKIEQVCGIYLKWKNPLGGWSYFLFNQKHQQVRNVKDLGYIYNDFKDILNNNRVKNIGKSSNDVYNIGVTGVTLEQRKLIETIIDSPKVYMFTGEPFSKAEATDWISVSLQSSSFIVKDFKDRVSDINFRIELPERFTLTL